MKRRYFLIFLLLLFSQKPIPGLCQTSSNTGCLPQYRYDGEKLTLSEEEWKERLTPEQFKILRRGKQSLHSKMPTMTIKNLVSMNVPDARCLYLYPFQFKFWILASSILPLIFLSAHRAVSMNTAALIRKKICGISLLNSPILNWNGYSSKTKYDAKTGWPSFWAPICPENVEERFSFNPFSSKKEVVCSRCSGHLGDVFTDGPPPTGLRYCMNSAALKFISKGRP